MKGKQLVVTSSKGTRNMTMPSVKEEGRISYSLYQSKLKEEFLLDPKSGHQSDPEWVIYKIGMIFLSVLLRLYAP